jgi:hypothetical protein
MGLFARIAVFLIVLALTGALTGAPASAQSPFGDFGLGQGAQRAEPEPDRPPDLEAYGSIAESYRASSALENTERQVARLRDRIAETLARAPHIAEDVRATLAAAAPSGEATYFLGLLVFLGFLLGIGRAVSILFAVYVARPIFVGMQKPNPQGLAEKLPVLATRVGMQAVIIAITVLVAVLVGSGFYPEDERASVVTAILFFGAFGVWRMADTMFRMLLAPFLPAYRLLAMSDRAAIRLYRWLSALLLYRILSHGAVIWLDQLGLSATTSAFLHLVAAAVEIVIVLVGGWVNRAAISNAIRGGRPKQEATWLQQGAAAIWGPALILVMLFAWLDRARVLVLGTEAAPPPPVSMVIMAFAAGMAIYALAAYAIERLGRRAGERAAARTASPTTDPAPEIVVDPLDPRRDPRADGDSGDDSDGDEGGGGVVRFPAEDAREERPAHGRMRTYADLGYRVASLLAIGTGLYILVNVSALRPLLLQEEGVLNRLGDVLDILFIGYILYHLIRIWIDRRIEEEGGDEIEMEPGDEGGGASASSRLATLLPLVRNFVLAVVLVSTGIFVAMELGINVAPLFAGAGVVGLAIGFGAQTLVRDILSGAFFLIDDAFRKGEYIDIGNVKGTVEKISVRSMQLRHHLGALNTVPFGEIHS